MSVDLPAELSPTSPSTSPGAIDRLTSRRAWIAPKVLTMPRISTSGPAISTACAGPGSRLRLHVLRKELLGIVARHREGGCLEPRRPVRPPRPLRHLRRDLQLVLHELGAQLHRQPPVLHRWLRHQPA